MASNMKAVKLRIRSVQSTKQITKAMELVASSKLRRAKDRAVTCRPYFQVLHQTLKDIANGNTDFTSVFVSEKENKKTCFIVIGGDRGLAGGYNANLIRTFESVSEGRECCVLPIGKKILEYAQRKGYESITNSYPLIAQIGVSECFAIAHLICREFREGKYGHVELCYTTFESMLSQKPETFPILPLMDIAEETGSEAVRRIRDLILYEPDASEVFDAIVPEYLAGLIYGAVCESVASELAARRNAMEAATKNADEMIEKLNLYYNRARQASITQEITEIVAGAEGI